jgi:hypothetical protein
MSLRHNLRLPVSTGFERQWSCTVSRMSCHTIALLICLVKHGQTRGSSADEPRTSLMAITY